MISNLLL